MQCRWFVFATLGALAACGPDPDTAIERKKPTHTVDAAPHSSPAGVVSCYSPSAPSATCSLPTHCCFSGDYPHEGACTATSCAWGTIDCDGPEDCVSGQRCCATYTDRGVHLACHSGACLETPAGDELCHEPSVCDDDRWCITADGTQPALPRALAICR